jgi:PPOX class probable F420-dependent enzyme
MSIDGLTPRAATFLAQARVAHLATTDGEGQPHVVPITFVLLGERLYSALDAKPKRVAAQRLRRVRNIQQNPRVAVVVDRYSEDWTRLGYVLVLGTARVVEASAETERPLAALRAKYAPYAEGPLALEDAALLVVEPQRAIVWGSLDDA